jgi:lipopolysaccharide transport system permease protein
MTATVRALRRTWGVRDYIVAAVKRDFVARYLGTQLGFFWAVAQPLALIATYTLVFAQIMRPALPGHDTPFAYSIHLCSGIVVWQLFSELLTRSVGVFVHNANLLKKVSLPKLALPVTVALSGLVNFAVILVLFVAFLVAIGKFPGIIVFALVPVVVIVVALALGLGVLLGSVNVFYRDVEHTVTLVLGFWFWLTPIVYPSRTLPDALAAVFAWNPMWPLVQFAQSIFVEYSVPPWSALAYPAVVAAALLAIGLRAYRALSGDIVDEL